VRRIARPLRPDVLEELDLPCALAALVNGFRQHTRVPVERRLAHTIDASPEEELVLYRVAEEALTNVARHAHATCARVRPAPHAGRCGARISDDGRGVPEHALNVSQGIRGVRASDACRCQAVDRQPGRWWNRRPAGDLTMTPLKTKILIADDHPIVLNGLRTVLNAQPDLEVVAEAGDGEQAVQEALAASVDLAILDISMPRKTGLQAAREITQRRPEVRVVMLSMHDNEQFLFEAIGAGASGYVLKSSVDRDLVEACRAAMRGEPFLYPAGVQALMRDYLDRARTGQATHREMLTAREEEIVKLIAEAYTNDEIAAMLHISKKTVERHRANILEKLGMRDRVELTRYAIRRGLVEP
jgi:DNA-binding NarL/FixJ family response regulator